MYNVLQVVVEWTLRVVVSVPVLLKILYCEWSGQSITVFHGFVDSSKAISWRAGSAGLKKMLPDEQIGVEVRGLLCYPPGSIMIDHVERI